MCCAVPVSVILIAPANCPIPLKVADVPDNAPVKVPPASGNFVAILFVTVVLKFASSPKAAANSFNVFKVPGAESTIKATLASALASV